MTLKVEYFHNQKSPRFEEENYVGWDKYLCSNQGIIYTTGMCPCLGIALYDSQTKQGAIAHLFGHFKRPEHLIFEMITNNFENFSSLEVVLCGESNLTKNPLLNKAEISREVLSSFGIKIVAEDVGLSNLGITGRDLFLNLETGVASIYRRHYL